MELSKGELCLSDIILSDAEVKLFKNSALRSGRSLDDETWCHVANIDNAWDKARQNRKYYLQ